MKGCEQSDNSRLELQHLLKLRPIVELAHRPYADCVGSLAVMRALDAESSFPAVRRRGWTVRTLAGSRGRRRGEGVMVSGGSILLMCRGLQLDRVRARVVVAAWQAGVDMKRRGRGSSGSAFLLTYEFVMRLVIWQLVSCVPVLVVRADPALCAAPSERSCELGQP